MSKSSDERIERHKRKQKEAGDAEAQRAQRAAEQKEQKVRFLADVRAKWASDSHIIAEILKDFGSKLGAQLQCSDLGAPPPNMAAHGRLTGRIGNQAPISIDLTVDEHGQLHAARSRPIGQTNVRFVGSNALIVTDATRERSEDFFLDLLDIEK